MCVVKRRHTVVASAGEHARAYQLQRVTTAEAHRGAERKHVHLHHPLENVRQRQVTEVHVLARKVRDVAALEVGHRRDQIGVRDERAFGVPRGARGVAKGGHVVGRRRRMLCAGRQRVAFGFEGSEPHHFELTPTASLRPHGGVHGDDELELRARAGHGEASRHFAGAVAHHHGSARFCEHELHRFGPKGVV